MYKKFIFWFHCLTLFLYIQMAENIKHPVILIPGDGGSQVNAKLDKPSVVSSVCYKKTNDFYTIWLSVEQLLPKVINCWVDNMSLRYNNVTRKTSNAEGVDVQIPGFGNSSVVEWLDPYSSVVGSYFKEIANALVADGYVRDVNIRGAPYDFRKAPNENVDYFKKLVNLIEETYIQNGNKSVILIAHSMGGPMVNLILQKLNQKWKNKYVRLLLGLSGAWGGSVKTMKMYLVGDNLGIPGLESSAIKAQQISCPSLAWLLPSNMLWKKNETIIETDTKNYTVNNFEEFFKDIDFEVGWDIYQDVLPYRNQLGPPGVEVHCLHGNQIDTTEKLIYKARTFPQGSPKIINGDGDGTVNIKSLESCKFWKNRQKQKVYHQVFPKVDHMNILKDKYVLQYVHDLLKKI